VQTNCPQCKNLLVLDDAKIPDTPFMLKCPKCQATVKLPGKGASAVQRAPAPSSDTPTTAALATPAPVTPPAAPPIGKALFGLPNADSASAMGAALGRLGFASESLDPQLEEKILRLQQGEYPVVVTSRNGMPEERNLYRIVRTLSAEIRRRVFLILVGDEFKTGEGTQAFAVLADLVVQATDGATCERVVAQTMIERRRVYQVFWDAEERKAEGRF